MESIQKALNDTILMFHDRMSGFEAELQRTPGTSSTNILATDFHTFKAFIKEMLNNLQQQMELLARNVDNMEMRSRRKMLLLHGIAEHDKEDTARVVADMVREKLKVSNFQAGDLKRCHRMGRATSGEKPRPILIKFSSMEARQKFWFAKSNLKGSGATISEFLTKSRHSVFMAAREKFGINKCWTRDGFIYILSPDGSRHKIVSADELSKLQPTDVSKPPTAVKNTSVKTRRAVAAVTKK